MTSGKDRKRTLQKDESEEKINMKQLIHYFWTGPIKKISLKNLAIMQKKALVCSL